MLKKGQFSFQSLQELVNYNKWDYQHYIFHVLKSHKPAVGMCSFCKGKLSFFKWLLFNLNELRERKATGSVNIYHQVGQDT